MEAIYESDDYEIKVSTARKQKIYEGGFPREFVVKASLRRITEETRFVVKRLS